MGMFFKNVSGSTLDEIPEVRNLHVPVPDAALFYVADTSVGQRMIGQAGKLRVPATDAYATLQGGGQIYGWTGSLSDLKRIVDHGESDTDSASTT